MKKLNLLSIFVLLLTTAGTVTAQFGQDIAINHQPGIDQQVVKISTAFNGWVYTAFNSVDSLNNKGGITIRRTKDDGVSWTNIGRYNSTDVRFPAFDIIVTGNDANNLTLYLAAVWHDLGTNEYQVFVDKYNASSGGFVSSPYTFSALSGDVIKDVAIASDYRVPADGANPYSVAITYSIGSALTDKIMYAASMNGGASFSVTQTVASTATYFRKVALSYGIASGASLGWYFVAWENLINSGNDRNGDIYVSRNATSVSGPFIPPVNITADSAVTGKCRNPSIAVQYNSTYNDSGAATAIVLMGLDFYGDASDYDIVGFYNKRAELTNHWTRFFAAGSGAMEQHSDVVYDHSSNNFRMTYSNSTNQSLPYRTNNVNVQFPNGWTIVADNYAEPHNATGEVFPQIAVKPNNQKAVFAWTEKENGNGAAYFDAEQVDLTESAPFIHWQNTIGGNANDALGAVQQTSDGGYILGGNSTSGISGDKTEASKGSDDIWVVKLDISGSIQWQNTIGGASIDVMSTLQQTTDGGYILGASSESGISGDKTEPSRGSFDYWVIKLDVLGNIQWQKTIGGSSIDALESIEQTTDGGYILAGNSRSEISGDKTEANQGSTDYWVVKLDMSGNIQWQNNIGGDGSDDQVQIKQTTDGGYFVGGTSRSSISGDKTEAGHGTYDYWVLKLDASGNILWQNTIGGSSWDELSSVQETIDGGYIVGGNSISRISGDKTEPSMGEFDYWVVKLDSLGNILWQNTIGGNSDDYINSIQQTTNQEYIIAGYSYSDISGDKTEANQGHNDYWVMKLDPRGNILWEHTIGGDSTDVLSSVAETADGGLILGGSSISGISGDKTEAASLFDYWILKLCFSPTACPDITGIDQPDNNFGSAFTLFPNPTAERVSIDLGGTYTDINITVTDILGRLVLQMHYDIVKTAEMELDGASGLYIINIQNSMGSKTAIKALKRYP